ncbi:AraC family transcriptional regulator [Bacillus freudenreichii]|nr:AraC family transcriptional regulator [Bacillus freudenreichii]
MALVESLQRAIDYMEDHLLDSITIDDVAKQANVSTFHFQRKFMILTDMSV